MAFVRNAKPSLNYISGPETSESLPDKIFYENAEVFDGGKGYLLQKTW